MSLLDDLAHLWKRCHFYDDGYELKLLSLRGTTVRSGQVKLVADTEGLFNDTMFLIDRARNQIDHVTCTAGQPGWYWVKRNPKGSPFTRVGCYDFIRGTHRGEYRCLVQDEDNENSRIAVIRDVTRDGTPSFEVSSKDQFEYIINTGIHIHCSKSESDEVGSSSDGCHVVRSYVDSGDWELVDTLVFDYYRSQKTFHYGVVNGSWLFDEGQRLMMGSVGIGVEKLQQFLVKNSIKCPVNGLFHEDTDKAYRKWQRLQGRVQNGICCNPSWLV